MRISKKATRRRILADTEVAPEASELLFETEDVADLLAEVTGENVEVEATPDAVEFTVGEDVFSVEPEEDAEVVESATRVRRSAVKASTRARRSVRRSVRR